EVHRFLVATAGPNEADDCFQETFLAALRAYPRLRPDSNMRSWLLTIAHRKAIDAHRARGRRAVPVAEVERGGAEDHALRGAGEEPELWARVRALPPKQRAAVVLRYVADLSHAEAAEVIGCSEEAARRSLHEALSKLRKDGMP
ncbi:MAG TPA: RNA polymerase sigma factor, partial [Solirubrobacteraceae bacterium]|nr:RNA polymerase sigma factor [Solirubrobacteraceae bacterium]